MSKTTLHDETHSTGSPKRLNIAMVCDFFYPQLGGVEFHIYHLSQKLISLGHNVVILTHSYGKRRGVRYLNKGLKVYYIPYLVLYRNTTFPTIFTSLPIMRNIFIRESIDIVHSHGSVSTFAHECLFHAGIMDIPSIFTDHSLYGFDNIGVILVNKLLRFSCTLTNRMIAVSNTTKENMCVRTGFDPQKVVVIPNAVVPEDFQPNVDLVARNVAKAKKFITIVVIQRLFSNKGSELLTHMIPKICQADDKVKFIIAGDGPKFIDFQQMIETFRLQERVELIGSVPHEKVPEVMRRGDIYLHASLIEAFGTVLVEAASCGLLIVSTMVGGIPEVLPQHMTIFSKETSVACLAEATKRAIDLIRNGYDTSNFHKEIASMYHWTAVAQKTANVYTKVILESRAKKLSMSDKISRFFFRNSAENRYDGLMARCLYTLCCVVEMLYYAFLEYYWQPRNTIELARKWESSSDF
ncbi:hypothetical protein ACO0QE_002356 [Hanseniaspora vineae]